MKNVPEIIEKLVERFERDIDSLKSATYNETELRADFVNPFWKALGWDMTNEKGYAMQYRDVKQEYPLKTGLTTEAPDYCFTIAGKPKFFLETKKPSVDVKHAIHPAYQLRRYGWSGKLPLSILTDFEEMAVYDCRIRPEKNDNPSQARIKLYTYTDYIDLWDEISGIFSREAILKGSFDKYADSTKGKRGTSEVDSEFLKEIEIWRDKLARNIALRNPRITVRELNFAVQATIDRIIFLRMAEDRGIEEYAQLQALCSRDNIYKYLLEIFYRADTKYNSGLFHFTAEKDRPEFDNLTPKLKIDDKVLNEILSRLYYPESPYEFSFMPTEILGNVYEQFLGKVIHLTKGHQAKIEEKPEVKKAGGVYYTPEYIVEYIVANTVGKLCENKTPKEISDLRILDPACGSGSFLIGAYRFLLDYHLKWYLSEKEQKGKIPTQPETSQSGKKAKRQPAIYQGQDGEWYMSTSEKKRILLNNIYGVDIDSQAVEVTKLSLLLKVLENENKATLLQQIALFKERALPDLSDNIKCGNSLIGSDFYDRDGQTMLFDEEEQYRINAFDWDVEFPEVFKRKKPGFDAVIGNPPWGAEFHSTEQVYLSANFYSACGRTIDSYALFIEIALKLLCVKGKFGLITPDTFLRKDDHRKLRELILKNYSIVKLVETGPVYSKVRDTWCAISIINKELPTPAWKINHKKISRFVVSSEERLLKFSQSDWNADTSVKQEVWAKKPFLIIGYLANENEQRIINKIEKHPQLGEYDNYNISRGEEGSKFRISQSKTGAYWMVFPEKVKKFWVDQGAKVEKETLTESKCKDIYNHPKIWIIRIQKMRWVRRIVCGLDLRKDSAGMKTLQSITAKNDDVNRLKYLQAILSSNLINYWCINYLADDMNKAYLSKIPIRELDVSISDDKTLHDHMVQLVENMLDLHKRLPNANAPHDKQTLQRQIDATDRQIDKLVYELYGLTEEEIKIVENNV